MTILNILHFPDTKLRQKAELVEVFDEKLKILANDMLETMYDAKGIGLAAVQVNIIKRLLVIDISEDRDNPLILINPAIKTTDEKIQFEEALIMNLKKLKP